MTSNINIIEEFKRIRDIPYRIPLSIDEPDECCSGKAEMLFNIFQQNGYEARYRLCTFKWDSISFPEELQNIPYDNDSSHTYLEVKINNQWKIVDATWDKKLEGLFTVNEWDGKSDTEIAVKYDDCLSPEESIEYIKHISTPEAIISDLKVNGSFYKAFNEWLERYRKSK